MRLSNVLLCVVIFFASGISSYARTDAFSIRIVSFALKPDLPSDVSTWADVPEGMLLTAQLYSNKEPIPSNRVVQIKQGDRIICGNTVLNGLPTDPFTQREFILPDFKAGLSPCPKLDNGEYTLCIQFFDDKHEAVSAEVCKVFEVKDAATKVITYTPPEIVSPADNSIFTHTEIQSPITFKWTPINPTPTEQVTYRLRIWPVTDGQDGAQAMNQNQPIAQKEIKDGTQIALTNVLTCEASNTCRFIWIIQAVNSQGIAIGSNNGSSQPASLVVSDYIIRLDSLRVKCTATPGLYTFSYTLSNPNAGTAKLTNFVVTSSVPGGATITSFTPPLNTNIAGGGGSLTITGTITGSPSLSNICIGAEITDLVNSFWKASRDTCTKVGPCACDACDPKKVNIDITPTTNIVINANNTLTLNQPISIATTPAKLVKSIKAELVYFEYVPESEECMPCNKDSKTYGNLDNGTLTGATGPGIVAGTHSLLWNFIPPKNFSGTNVAAITISIPPIVKCCQATIRWCIRYVVTFTDCTVCNKLVCYEKKKDGCLNGDPTNPNQH